MTPIAWPEAQRICDIPEVREALDKFAADAHEENMLAMVSAIMGARPDPKDDYAALEGVTDGEWEELAVALCEEEGHEPYELLWTHGLEPEPWGDRWCKYEDDAKKMIAMVRKYAAISPTPSDAGKDDALLTIARDALEEIALAGMSGSGQESEEGMRDWHARRAWQFIGIAARAKTAIDAAIAAQGEHG